MASTVVLIAYPVNNIEQAKTFYTTYLGTEPYADTPYYVGYKVGNQEIGLDPNATGIVTYIEVDDIATDLQTLREAGATVVKDVTDVGMGLLIAQVEIDGNIMGIRQQPKQ